VADGSNVSENGQGAPGCGSYSFAISVLTALLMKLAIDAVKGLEHRVAGYFRSK
jgi:hypothetical protein